MAMWWQQNTCKIFAVPQSLVLLVGKSTAIAVCAPFCQGIFVVVVVFGGVFLFVFFPQQQQVEYYTIRRFFFYPTWIWSKLSFNMMSFLSGGAVSGLVLDVMGEFCIYFIYRR